ncbi:OmpA family protein [Flavobacterium hercynium]|uniref:OmpA-like domain-containing protein n=1 Tax=Flavobacterium hercynium TaxID=387094 RepID=A0A226GNL1_9FLAO|nr:OmpA family protein [Flavobacterium hercynium]OXA83071.1 hypothetical protein B0A66_22595 [Flavobacterium hercynium]SMP25828.1 WD40-like Beta Propeller Repeat [Flavobacterium hercynium]
MIRILTLFFCLSYFIGFSQNKNNNNAKILKAADEKFDEFSFIEARGLYRKLVKRGYKNKKVYAHLGDTFYYNSDYVYALKWYEKLMNDDDEDDRFSLEEYYHKYWVCLRASDKHEKAAESITNYWKKNGDSDDVKKWNPIDYLFAIEEQSGRYTEVTDAGFTGFGVALVPNQAAIEQDEEIEKFKITEKTRILKESIRKRMKADNNRIGLKADIEDIEKGEPQKEEDSTEIKQFKKLPRFKEIIFATARDSGVLVDRKHQWDRNPYLIFCSAEISEDGKLLKQKKLAGDLNSKYHQSTPVLTKDGMTMYFTRSVPTTKYKSKKANRKEVSHLKIFKADKVGNKWTNISELPYPINIEGTSSGHPALTPTDDQLYFSSNRKKKVFDSDLYVVSRKKNGKFEKVAESLGDDINTFGRETFPFVDSQGILYFASDGHPGLGGLDVYAAVKDSEDKYQVVNLGEPVNSSSDDFGYIIDNDSEKGYFSSNRKYIKGKDNLFSFIQNKPVTFPFKTEPLYFGIVKDIATGEVLEGVQIKIYNELNEEVETLVTDKEGKYVINLPPLKSHSFEFKKKGYAVDKVFVEGTKISQKTEIPVALFNELVIKVDDKFVTLKENDNLAEILKLKPIYFDYGGYSLRKSSKAELDKVIDILKSHPRISLEINAHTDSRGREDFNLKLSKNRAKTTVDYMINEGGISSDRLKSNGFGETQLINNCTDNVDCTAAEHELNRRCEFLTIIAPEE